MILLLLAYLGGALTIVSPCILPVLPFVFAQSGRRGFRVYVRLRSAGLKFIATPLMQ